MSDIYYQPESYGLSVVGEAEFSSGSYEFDTTVVWQDKETGALYFAHDSGCSCPTPFDGYDRSNITKVGRIQDLIDHLDEIKREQWWWGDDDYYGREQVEGACGELIQKAREAQK